MLRNVYELRLKCALFNKELKRTYCLQKTITQLSESMKDILEDIYNAF